MTLSLGDLRLLAWHGPFEPCATCGETVGRRCRTTAGNVTTPHAPRLQAAKGYDARQPEVDELNRAIELRDATISDSNDALRANATEITGLNEQVAAQDRDLAATKSELAASQVLIAGLRARIAELEKPTETVLYANAAARRIKLPAGKRGGGAGANTGYPLAKPVDEATTTYELMFETPFDWAKAGKLPGPCGVIDGVPATLATGGKDCGDKAWSGRLMWLTPTAGSWLLNGTRRRAKAPAEIVGYEYHAGQADQFGDNEWTGFVPTVGQWFTVTIRTVMNTVGKNDGVLQISINGDLLVDRHDYVWRTRPDLHITHYLEAIFPGGGDDSYASTVDRYVRIRNVRVTTPAA